MSILPLPSPITRKFVPTNLRIKKWEDIAPYFEDLQNRPLPTVRDLIQWIKDRSELKAVIRTDYGWRYINTSRFTDNEDYKTAYQTYIKEISPNISKFDDALNKKLTQSPFLSQLNQETYEIYLRNINNALTIFRANNIPLFAKDRLTAQKSSKIEFCTKND